VQLERRGVHTVTIVTDAFFALATAQARTRGRSDLAFVVIAHPVGGLRPDELAERIAHAVRELVQPRTVTE
jgi:hypothetical protein